MIIRQPIVSVLGHVDHGKTTLLDKIRNTGIAAKEPGGITQQIGATEISVDVIASLCKNLIKKENISIPGFLFIDTPGHKAFSNLRHRGGSLADIVILVIDITSGIQPQTIESIEILKTYRTPFVIVANKIDTISGWISVPYGSFLLNIKNQLESTLETLDTKIYELIEQLSNIGINADRFDRVSDFSSSFAIIPTSAKTGEGIPDLLTVLVGLSQKYLKKDLVIDQSKNGEAAIIEVSEDQKTGKWMDIILYNGILSVGNTVIVSKKEGYYQSTVKSIMKNVQHGKNQSLKPVKQVSAATGVRVVLNEMSDIVPGGYMLIIHEKINDDSIYKKFEEVTKVNIATEKEGILIKTDSIGALEALAIECKESNINISNAEIGEVTKSNVVNISQMKKIEHRCILAFKVSVSSDAQEEARKRYVKIIQGNIIYDLIKKYSEWTAISFKELEEAVRKQCTNPVIIQVLPNFIYRKSKPAIVGIKVIKGTLYKNTPILNENGDPIGKIESLQKEKESLDTAKEGSEIAVAISDAIYNKNLFENDFYYSNLSLTDIKTLRGAKILSNDEEEIIKKIITIKRKKDRFWGEF